MPKAALADFSLPQALLTSFDTNDRINQYMIENLPAKAWRAEPPDGKGRTVAAVVAHLHNVRVMWLKATAKGSKIPEPTRSHERDPSTGNESARAKPGSFERGTEIGLGKRWPSKRIPSRCGRIPRLSDCPRRAPSRPNLHARPPGGPPFAPESHVRHVGVGHPRKSVNARAYTVTSCAKPCCSTIRFPAAVSNVA